MPGNKYKPRTPPHFNSSVLCPTWKCFSFQDEEPITSLPDWLFRRGFRITSWLTLPLNQVWTRTLRFSWLTWRKEGWWCRERANLHDWGRTISNQSVYSIKIQSHENSGAIQCWTEEMTRKHLPDEASCFWELASARLLFLFHFYSSAFLLKFSFSDTIDIQETVFVVCKIEPPRGYFKISFSWTVQAINSYDSVSKLC